MHHNYFLADALHRAKGQNPLIPHYQAVVIDEGHKFLGAARQMYGVELSGFAVAEITGDILNFTYQPGTDVKSISELAISLYGQAKRLFMLLEKNIQPAKDEDEAERFAVTLNKEASAYFHNIRRLCGELMMALHDKPVLDKYIGRCSQILWELGQVQEQATLFEHHQSPVYWLEKPGNPAEPELGKELVLHAIPKRLEEMLHRDLWRKGIPMVFTSGTLSASGSFEHMKRITGLHRLPQDRLLETSKPSPFNHYDNSLIYISEAVPFPDSKDKQYILAVADECERLITASHGHAAVLFTSYRAWTWCLRFSQNVGLVFRCFAWTVAVWEPSTNSAKAATECCSPAAPCGRA